MLPNVLQRLGLIGLTALAAAPALISPATGQAGDPVSVLVVSSADSSGTKVTLSFSRRVEYRLEESRSRLRLVISAPVAESSMADTDLGGDLLKRIRFDETSRGTEVLFYLGRAFATFSSAEADNPFRLVIQFQREGGAPSRSDAPGTQGPPGGEAGDEEQLPDVAPTRIIVIDPGHGGSEEGAVSRSGLKEKDLVLDIARRLKGQLTEAGYRALLTHEGDEGLGLTERTAFANHAKASLFLSIHANASMRPGVSGPETYFLSYGNAAVDDQAAALARRESLAGLGTGASAGRELDAVLWEMAQAGYLTASSRLAAMIQEELNDLGGLEGRGVKQAPFRVLVGAAMPAVLVEVGFLTNADEEKKLASQEYREQVARALAGAVQTFTQQRERQEGALVQSGGAPR